MSNAVILVTGGAGFLGRAVTRAFLEDGDRVAVPVYKMDMKDALDPLTGEFGDRLHSFALDLTTERGAGQAVRQVVEWGGRLDSVVHLIGGYEGGLRIADTPVELWDRMLDLNLKSAWLIARAALPALIEGGSGSFVFVSARAAWADRKGHAPYAIAKSGVLTLVEAIAEEYRMDGIRANAILPGTIDTLANRRQMPDADHERWTRPEDIARVIRFLASPAAHLVNGATVPVYGRS